MRRQNRAAISLINQDQNPPQNQTLARRTPVALGKYTLPLPYVIARKMRGPLSLIARAENDRIQKGGMPEPKTLSLIESVALRAVTNCRGIARGLSALAETGGDLYGAFRRLPDRFRHSGPPAIVITIEGGAPLTLPEGAQDHIYRIVQEAITNAVKHADARRIDVVLKTAPNAIRLTVRDDGRGLPADFARRGGLGWASMHHRASAIGAHLYVTNSNDGGTEVRLEYGHVAVARGDRSG